jgi:hypothetical protein
VLQIDTLLKDGGGKKHSYLSDMISHVIAGDGVGDEVSIAKDLFQLPVVTVSIICVDSIISLLLWKVFHNNNCGILYIDFKSIG